MPVSNGTVWVLVSSPEVRSCIEKTLKEVCTLVFHKSLQALREATRKESFPSLLIAEAQIPGDDFLEALSKGFEPPCPFALISQEISMAIVEEAFSQHAQDVFAAPLDPILFKVKVKRWIQESQRCGPPTSGSTVSDFLSLDSFTLTVTNGARESATLTRKEFQILSLLSEGKAHALSRNELCEKIWNDVKVSGKTFDVHLFRLRQKLESLGFAIQFKPERGYSLVDNRTVRPSGSRSDPSELDSDF